MPAFSSVMVQHLVTSSVMMVEDLVGEWHKTNSISRFFIRQMRVYDKQYIALRKSVDMHTHMHTSTEIFIRRMRVYDHAYLLTIGY